MKKHEFSIIASGLDPLAQDFETRFYDAGCDDATIAFQRGQIIADFAREAASLEEAIAGAVEAVNEAGAKVERVEPDPLVSLSDIAERAGMTRAAISAYAKGIRADEFPAPVARVTSESPLWDWATVAHWMFRRNKLAREAVIDAEIVKCANEAIRAGHVRMGGLLKKRAEQYKKELAA
jgi:transcriptional regulator with XRE-family HTH domain